MGNSNTTIRIIIILLIISGGFIIFSMIVKSFKMQHNSIQNSKYYYDINFDKEDSVLFKESSMRMLKPIFVLKSNYRNDIKSFDYNNQCKLQLIKVDLNEDISMERLIEFRKVPSEETTMHTYDDFSKGGSYDFLILSEKIPKANKIIFCLDGDDKYASKRVFNKNFVSYYLPISTFSIRYGEKEPVDIFLGGKEIAFGIRIKYPLMVSFYKTQKSLYVMILIPNKNEMNLDGDLLRNIMDDNSLK